MSRNHRLAAALALVSARLDAHDLPPVTAVTIDHPHPDRCPTVTVATEGAGMWAARFGFIPDPDVTEFCMTEGGMVWEFRPPVADEPIPYELADQPPGRHRLHDDTPYRHRLCALLSRIEGERHRPPAGVAA